MRIVFTIVNEQLTHGQVAATWIKKYRVQKIILVDDELVQDSFVKEVLQFSIPRDVTVQIRSVIDTLEVIEQDTTDKNTMLLFKSLKYVLQLVNYGYTPKELNICSIGSSQGRKLIVRDIYMSDEEKNILRQLIQSNIFVYVQKLPQDSQINLVKEL